uniref:Uncharacterized protein n=1 Tax=Arundo donax TaxID=35708 RepID=A0A0A9C0Y4_ARUDO
MSKIGLILCLITSKRLYTVLLCINCIIHSFASYGNTGILFILYL